MSTLQTLKFIALNKHFFSHKDCNRQRFERVGICIFFYYFLLPLSFTKAIFQSLIFTFEAH